MAKAHREYKCAVCKDVIAKKGQDIGDIEVWYSSGEKTVVFCGEYCAAKWSCDEDDLESIQEMW